MPPRATRRRCRLTGRCAWTRGAALARQLPVLEYVSTTETQKREDGAHQARGGHELARNDVELTAAQLELIKTNVECACGPAVPTSGTITTVECSRRRKAGTPTTSPSAEMLKAACGDRLTISNLADLQLEAARYRSKWLTGCWRTRAARRRRCGRQGAAARLLQPNQVMGARRRQTRVPARCSTASQCGGCQCRCSSACVERGFSILHYYMQSPHVDAGRRRRDGALHPLPPPARGAHGA